MGLELGHHRGVPAEREIQLGELLARHPAQFLEAGDRGLRPLLVRDVDECRTAPEIERATQPAGCFGGIGRSQAAGVVALGTKRSASIDPGSSWRR